MLNALSEKIRGVSKLQLKSGIKLDDAGYGLNKIYSLQFNGVNITSRGARGRIN